MNPDATFSTHKDQKLIVCPGTNGGKNWPAGAYSPRTNAMYMPMQNLCMNATTQTDKRDPRSSRLRLHAEHIIAPGADEVGAVWAISAETGKTLWKHEQRAGVMSLVATGGGLVFGGDADGRSRRRRHDRQGAVGDEPRLAGERLPDHVRRRRQAVRRGDDRPVAGRGDLADGHTGAPGRFGRRAVFVFALP